MNYAVFDLEFNQGFDFNNKNSKVTDINCPFEIIDIGAVKLDEKLNIIATFDEHIRPTVYKRLHPYVIKLTGISIEELKTARRFNDVYNELNDFISDVDILCVWGTTDIKELIRNIKYHKLDASIVPKEYINVQHYASKQLDAPGGNSIGLSNAVKFMNIPLENQFHRAFNDAYYTSEVFKKIYNTNIKPETYCYESETKARRYASTKSILDTNKLIAQFEKMLNRNITREEKDIIMLAYKMGRTNQFQKKK